MVYTSTICGFVLSKYKFKGEISYLACIGYYDDSMVCNNYSKIHYDSKFGWMDSYKALIIPAMFSGFGIFMMKQHIETIPDDY